MMTFSMHTLPSFLLLAIIAGTFLAALQQASAKQHQQQPSIKSWQRRQRSISGDGERNGIKRNDQRSALDDEVFHPYRISWNDLLVGVGEKDPQRQEQDDGASSFLTALATSGIVVVTDIPEYVPAKRAVMRHVHRCAKEIGVKHRYRDGTERWTVLASRSTDENDGGLTPRSVGCADDDEHHDDDGFDASNLRLRDIVGNATEAFAAKLTSELDLGRQPPLLERVQMGDEGDDADRQSAGGYDTLLDVVKHGQHLEHYHSYYHPNQVEDRAMMRVGGEVMAEGDPSSETIGFHRDAGLFLAFAPGQWYHNNFDGEPGSDEHDYGESVTSGEVTSGFYIELKDGSRPAVAFDESDLVFMLGDGVDQYINLLLLSRQKEYQEGQEMDDDVAPLQLRAVPHALRMPPTPTSTARTTAKKDGPSMGALSSSSRVWYGRMVLPPPSAIHPVHNLTFGHIRRLLIEGASAGDERHASLPSAVPPSIGCSSRDLLIPRQLELATACQSDDEFYCWHKCEAMATVMADFNVSEDVCASEGLELQCRDVNNGDLWTRDVHGPQFQPICWNATANNTDDETEDKNDTDMEHHGQTDGHSHAAPGHNHSVTPGSGGGDEATSSVGSLSTTSSSHLSRPRGMKSVLLVVLSVWGGSPFLLSLF